MGVMAALARRTSGETRLQWLPAAVSVAGALGLSLYLAFRRYQVDIDVYRMGGQHVLSRDLYSLRFGNSGLVFTYTPFAALVFAVLTLNLGIWALQDVWAVLNVVALAALIYLSMRIVVPRLQPKHAARWALLLLLPALALNPVFTTVGLGQINLVLCFLITWDLATHRRIGGRTLPLGIATGIAAAVKLTPLIFVPYLIITRRTSWSPQRGHHVPRMSIDCIRRVPPQLMDLLDKGRPRFQAGRRAALHERPELVERFAAAPSRFRFRLRAGAGTGGDRCRGVGARSVGASAIVPRVGASGVRDDRPDHLTHHLGPPHGVGGAGDHLACRRNRPTETRPAIRRIDHRAVHRRSDLVGPNLLERQIFAGAASESLAALSRQFLLVRHARLLGRRHGHARASKPSLISSCGGSSVGRTS